MDANTIRDDLAAVDAMMTAARDHAASAADQTSPESNLRTRCAQLVADLAKAHAHLTWIKIDLDELDRRHAARATAAA